MSDFNKYSNYNENSSHSSVVFGAESPLLEVELNELQQIINTKLSRIINSIGSCVIPVEEDSITFDDSTKTLSITNSIIIEDSGLTAYVKSSSIVISGTNSVAYFEMKEVEATRYSTLKEYGNTAGEEVENTIKDNRTLSETSRRKIVTYTLKCGSSIPSNTDTIKYVEVGSYNGSNFNFKKNLKQVIDCIPDTYAKKSLYDESVNVGRKPDSTIGEKSFAFGKNVTSSKKYAHAEGESTTASGNESHSEGFHTTASKNYAHVEGYYSTASSSSAHAEGNTTTASGESSHAEGSSTIASSSFAHAEGSSTVASGGASHAEGSSTIASGEGAHAEGYANKNGEQGIIEASGYGSHAEGYAGLASSNDVVYMGKIQATGKGAHAEGYAEAVYGYSPGIGYQGYAYTTLASGDGSHAEGCGTTASGENSHAEGSKTTASSDASHAEGYGTIASGYASHAEGCSSTSSGTYSHAEGYGTKASSMYSHAGGIRTEAYSEACFASGKYNTVPNQQNTASNSSFIVIGKGSSDNARSNALRLDGIGCLRTAGTITASTTADYAEFFEWIDGNKANDDRVGHFVTLEGNKIRIATDKDDYILGVISGEPFVLGNGDCDVWNGMYLRDKFRRRLLEPAPKTEFVLDDRGNPTGEMKEVLDETGNVVYEGEREVLNPEYDNTKPYISRADRPEWDAVGMLGVLPVLHDGTAKVNGYVTVNKDGIATSCDKSHENAYRVIHENSEDVVEIIFRN